MCPFIRHERAPSGFSPVAGRARSPPDHPRSDVGPFCFRLDARSERSGVLWFCFPHFGCTRGPRRGSRGGLLIRRKAVALTSVSIADSLDQAPPIGRASSVPTEWTPTIRRDAATCAASGRHSRCLAKRHDASQGDAWPSFAACDSHGVVLHPAALGSAWSVACPRSFLIRRRSACSRAGVGCFGGGRG